MAIIVLDFDQALTGMIARTLRGQQFLSLPMPISARVEDLLSHDPKGIILAAPQNGSVELSTVDPRIFGAGVPILALGAAAAALCEQRGGAAEAPAPENTTLGLCDSPLFDGMVAGERRLHDLRPLTLPDGAEPLATATERCIGFRDGSLYAIEYPIERNDPDAVCLLTNFAAKLCGERPDWTEDAAIARAVAAIARAADGGGVMCAVSGGVDSAVSACLAKRAVGDRLRCVFVDTGLFRENEPAEVIGIFHDSLGIDVELIDARASFLQALSGLRDGREKERVATALLRDVLQLQLRARQDVRCSVVGTNFNDTLYGYAPSTESALETATVEPIRELFKDEVRRLAVSLGLPTSISERQPFPSSGLALRVFGEVTPERLAILRKADAIFADEIRAGGHDRRLWQYYATLSDNPDTGKGYAVILRASQPIAGGAVSSRLPYDLLERVVERILADVPSVARVVYDLTPSAHYSTLE